MGTGAPNLLLITIDSLRPDHLGCYGYSKDTSPNIDRLASKGVMFTEAISNGGQTPIAFPSILTSALPIISPDELDAPLRGKVTIAELLKQNGYYTATSHDNPFLANFYGYNIGFDISDETPTQFNLMRARRWLTTKWMESNPNSVVTKVLLRARSMLLPVLSRLEARPFVTAEEITKKVLSWPITSKKRFFIWLHYMDIHAPYEPLPKYASQFCPRPVSRSLMRTLFLKMRSEPDKVSPAEVETITNLYDADIKYVDDTIGLLFSGLGSDLIDNTIVIVTADHGEELGEHGRFSHETLYDEVIRIPLIMTGPGIKGGTVVNEQVSLIDLAPTIADFAKIHRPPGFHGKSLLPIVNGTKNPLAATISTTLGLGGKPGQRLLAYRTPNWKYIRTEMTDASEATLAEELYYLSNDPGETNSLHGASIEEAKRFELEAKNKLSQVKELKIQEKTEHEKERVKSRLRKLGKL